MATRRDVLKRVVYATPLIVTSLAVAPAFASRGSNQGNRQHGKKALRPLPPEERKRPA